MTVKKSLLGLAGIACVSTALPSTAFAADFYNSATTTAPGQQGVVHYLQEIIFAQGPGSYEVQAFTFGTNYSQVSPDQGLIIRIYTGGNTAANSTNVLAGATMVHSVSGPLTSPGATGNYTYDLNLTTPFTLTGTSFLVEFQLTSADFTQWSTAINGRFTDSLPTVGTSPGYVWNDANLNNVFTGAERTTFGQSAASARFSVSGVFTPLAAGVPEPATWAMLMLGFGAIGMTLRRRDRIAVRVRFA